VDSPDFVGGDDISEEYEFARSEDPLPLERFELGFCPSLFFVDGAVVAGSSGEDIVRYVYQLEMSDWASVLAFSGGFASPRGSSFVGELGALMCGVRFLSFDDAMASSHLFSAAAFNV
jgi:hypothetical protein